MFVRRVCLSLCNKSGRGSVTVRRRGSAMAAQQTVSVRAVPGEDRLQISFRYDFHVNKIRVFNMNRPHNEELGKALTRLSTNIMSKATRKKKKKSVHPGADGAGGSQEETGEQLPIHLYLNGAKLEETIMNSEAWVEGALLQVGDKEYKICVNPPCINSLALPTCIMAGFPAQPKIDAEFVDLERCNFVWYSEKQEVASSALLKEETQTTEKDVEHAGGNRQSDSHKGPQSSQTETSSEIWEEIHRGHWYMANNSDIGHRLKLVCVPANQNQEGEAKEAVSIEAVTAGPGHCPFENRHLLTQHRTSHGCFRAVSYNILADLYADSDFSRTHLFPYCPPYALAADYRKLLIVKELLGYNADIICLQEVDRRLFQNELLAAFDQHGMDGLLKLKNGEVAEGTAIFYHRDKFRLLGQHDLNMTEALMSQDNFTDLREKVSSKESIKNKMLERKSIMQVAALESKEIPNRRVLVATTHLYFHPTANHIRLLQMEICMRHIQEVMSSYEEEGQKPSLVFCGDFNSGPHSAVYQLLTSNHVPADHIDWHNGGEAELLEDITLTHPLSLISACGTPAYTNFTAGFHGCLDYIFIDQMGLKVKEIIPLPSHEEVTQQVALPNMVFPSDHLALVCDLTFKSEKAE